MNEMDGKKKFLSNFFKLNAPKKKGTTSHQKGG
jgi:hypothetical protein